MDQQTSPLKLGPMKPLVFPIEAVRAYSQERAARTTLREVAEQVGVGASTLHNFLRGSNPHPRIRLKLAAWYADSLPEGNGTMAARNAISALLVGYPAEHYAVAVRALVDGVAELFGAVGAEPPPWTREEASRT
jgi:transcriptional regulator with XRE-family HTH domain